ncbi:hypothetical protein DFH08DRAFT_1075283 [Mycena albidolilacea]|uniref:Uncharacterized protein n=1 Tax=Mycena albidolilacea TaxID=1033008 RepID=A0AAD7AHA7_9AGAR|nr:hypothetical protein DFH08DRAFT_1075283 [Mycena albidolilacea]
MVHLTGGRSSGMPVLYIYGSGFSYASYIYIRLHLVRALHWSQAREHLQGTARVEECAHGPPHENHPGELQGHHTLRMARDGHHPIHHSARGAGRPRFRLGWCRSMHFKFRGSCSKLDCSMSLSMDVWIQTTTPVLHHPLPLQISTPPPFRWTSHLPLTPRNPRS